MVDRRWLGSLLVLVLAAWAPPAWADEGDDPKWCRLCHSDEEYSAEVLGASVHGDMVCRDCHQGYHFDPHEAVEVTTDLDLSALRSRGVRAPEALVACSDCHDVPAETPGLIKHDGASAEESPLCVNCHGSPHRIHRPDDVRQWRLEQNERCIFCHGDAERMTRAGGSTEVVATYEHSVHARKLHLGSEEAPGCVDCHGGHNQRDLATNGAATCRQCHPSANDDFVPLGGHTPLTRKDSPVGYFTQKFFAWLTFTVIFILALHVLVDLMATLRRSMTRSRQPAEEEAPSAEETTTVVRFDVHQRLQHGLMAISFVLLVMTGWPLSNYGVDTSHTLVKALGGMEGCALIHRIAAIGLAVVSFYHLIYLAVCWRKRNLPLSMLPTFKDVVDLFHNALFFVGIRKQRPRFPRYSYFEKFDYWAVFWGMAIMMGSGLVRWFPEGAVSWLPAWAYEIAHHAHTDEALLAALAIFIWHFYNVHLRPEVFPMSWVFLTGRVTLHDLKEEHAQEYEAMMARKEGSQS